MLVGPRRHRSETSTIHDERHPPMPVVRLKPWIAHSPLAHRVPLPLHTRNKLPLTAIGACRPSALPLVPGLSRPRTVQHQPAVLGKLSARVLLLPPILTEATSRRARAILAARVMCCGSATASGTPGSRATPRTIASPSAHLISAIRALAVPTPSTIGPRWPSRCQHPLLRKHIMA